MKPIKLTMSNFGPFINETIDFTSLQDRQLFLITGKTGSGKTMIFDAMTFALYGTSSTNERSELTLRSQFAEDDQPAKLNFIFQVKDKTYEIDRTLKYFKQGLKNAVESKCTLYDITTEEKRIIAQKLTPCKEAVINIIKLDAEQFRQILVLPQGAFKKFLVSESTDKQKVLSTLFNTNRFKLIEEKIKIKATALKNELALAENHLMMLLEQYKGEPLEDMSIENEAAVRMQQLYQVKAQFKEQSQQLKSFKLQYDEVNGRLQQAIELNQAIAKFKQYEQELKALHQDLPLLQQNEQLLERKNRLENLIELNRQLDKLTIKLQKLNEDEAQGSVLLEEKKSELKQQTAALVQHERQKDDITQLELFNSRTKKYIDDEHEYKGLEEKLQDLKERQQEKQTAIKELEQKKSQLEYQIQQLEQHQENYWTVKSQYVDSRAAIDALERQLQDINDNNSKVDDKHVLQQQYDQDQIKLAQLKQSLPDQWQYVAPLQQHLHKGDHCPVCHQQIMTEIDSLTLEAYQNQHHEMTELEQIQLTREIKLQLTAHLAKQDDSEVKERLMSLQQQSIEQQEKVQSLEARVSRLPEVKQQLESSVVQLNVEREALTKITSDIEYKNRNYEMMIKDVETIDFQKFSNHWHDNERMITQYLKKDSELNKRCEKLTLEIAHKEEFICRLNAEISDLKRDVNELDTRISDRLKQLKVTSEEIISIDEIDEVELNAWIDQYKSKESLLKSRISIEEQIINGREPEQTDQLTRLKAELAAEIDQLNEQVQHQQFIIDHNAQLLKEIKDKLVAFSEQQRINAEYQSLDRVFSGKNDSRTNLENFVLSFYLDQSLLCSNQRFLEMTSHRYEFRRKQTLTGKRKQSGLDIEIYDYYSNAVRDLNTLSGGETFLASLSLALGLSDYVTQLAGGITLDSVFIDEGFGTLDNETLETAVRALIDLEQTGKMVGIISHVQLLKDRMPALLVVDSTGYTSSTHFELK